MTGTNHLLTGALIGTMVPNVAIALPLAVGSHFVLDSLPHFSEAEGTRSTLTRIVWSADAVCIVLLIWFVAQQSTPVEYVVILSALAAMAPDSAWIYRLVVHERFGSRPARAKNWFNALHARIQRYEFRNGYVIEVFWTVGMVMLLSLAGYGVS